MTDEIERKKPVRFLSRDELLELWGKPRFDEPDREYIVKVEESDETTSGNEFDG